MAGQRATRACSGKQSYPDQASARLALQWVLSKGKFSRGKAPCRVYPCEACDSWHLTSKPVSGKKPPWDSDPDWVRPPRDAGQA